MKTRTKLLRLAIAAAIAPWLSAAANAGFPVISGAAQPTATAPSVPLSQTAGPSASAASETRLPGGPAAAPVNSVAAAGRGDAPHDVAAYAQSLSPDARKLLEQTRRDADVIAGLRSENAVLKERIERANLLKSLRDAEKPATVVSTPEGQTFVSEIAGTGRDLRAILVDGKQSYRVHVGSRTPLGTVATIGAQGVLLKQGRRSVLVGLGEAQQAAKGLPAAAGLFGLPSLPTVPTFQGAPTQFPAVTAPSGVAGVR